MQKIIKKITDINIEKMKDPVILAKRSKTLGKVQLFAFEFGEGIENAAVLEKENFYRAKEELEENTNLYFIPRSKNDSKDFWGCWIK